MTNATRPTARTWSTFAACRKEDPELFFPIGDSGPARVQAEQAKAVCRRCPVLNWCGAWVMEHRQEDGVWAATTPDERRSVARRAYRQAARS